MTELHTSTNHVNDYILHTDYVQQLFQDNNLDYFVRDYISHSTSIQSHYTLHKSHYQGASLVNYYFNGFTLHYTLANGYMWDATYYTTLSNYSTFPAYTPTTAQSNVLSTAFLAKLQNTYWGHYLLTNTHGSEALRAQLLRTLRE